MTVQLTDSEIELDMLINKTRNESAGAIVTFQGTVRKKSGEIEVESLTYESYRDMALKTIEQIVKEAIESYGVLDINVVHRLGNVKLTEDSVAICVASAHRKEAFKACEYVIDEIKTRVPIWKKDITPEGKELWRD